MLREVTNRKVSSLGRERLVWRGEGVLVFGSQEDGPAGSHVWAGDIDRGVVCRDGRELLSS